MINRRLTSEYIYRGRIINLRVDQVELPNGSLSSREIIEHPGATVIVPLDDQGRVHLVRQYRDAVDEPLLELPAGKLKPGEEPVACARRELLEELGLSAADWRHLKTFYSSPGFSDEVLHVFLAQGLEKKEKDADREEFIEVEVRPLEPIAALVGELKDGKSVAGVLLAQAALAGGE